jgi:hypothetical protein
MSMNSFFTGTAVWDSGRIGSAAQWRSIRQYAPFGIALGLAAGYAYLLAWFNRVDFYHDDFFVYGLAVTVYQIARLTFIPYFAWTVYAVGAMTNHLVFGCAAAADTPSWERYPLFFIAGAGVWHVVMFAIGLAGFDIKPVAVALSLGAMSFSVPHLAECVRQFAAGLLRARVRFDFNCLLTASLGLGIIAVTAIFLLVKGLYPGGGHDYYNHYFQFYKRVIETGSILPNDVWYHFYYSKGAGLYFLGMLLTDPLAPQLVTTGFIGCGAAVVYALLRTATRSTPLALIGVLLYVGVFIYTPGPALNMGHGGWGILEKFHELTAVLLLAVIWIAYRSFRNEMAMPGPWTLALHSAVVCIALLTLSLTLLVGLYLAGYVAWFAITQQWRVATRPFAAGVTAAFSLLAVGAINYHYTGFPSDMLITQFWPYADLAKVVQWGTLLEILEFHHDVTGMLQSAIPISWGIAPLLATFLRLELWWPVILAAMPFVVYQLRNRNARTGLRARADARAWSAVTWFGAVVILIALFGGGRTQPISFYRLSTFSYAPTLCLSLMFCHLGLARKTGTGMDSHSRYFSLLGMIAAAIAVIIVSSAGVIAMVRQNATAILINASNLWNGRFSVKDAYQNQVWSGAPWGGIYPGIVEPWRIAGPGTRIWSFHIQSYCMLPDCNIQGFFSIRFSPSWQTVYFGEPEQAVKALQAEGFNYFFLSTELGAADPLLLSRLFLPTAIGKYLAIRWTDGTSYLLTWPGANTRPIDRRFLAAYSNTVNDKIINDQSWKDISDYIDRHKEHLRPFFLPWCTNCAGLERVDAAAQR